MSGAQVLSFEDASVRQLKKFLGEKKAEYLRAGMSQEDIDENLTRHADSWACNKPFLSVAEQSQRDWDAAPAPKSKEEIEEQEEYERLDDLCIWQQNVMAEATALANKQIAAYIATQPASKSALADALDIEEKVSPNRVLTAADFMGALAPREWAIKDLQPLDAQLCAIYGDSTVGKSFLMIDVGCAIHRGVPWNGRPTRKGRVIYLCAEGSGDFRYRLHAYAKHHSVDPSELPRVIDNAPDLFNEQAAHRVIEQIQAAGGCDTLIIDGLSATFTGNENGSEMGAYLNNIKRIRRACCKTIWLIAHSGRDATKGIRGWSGTRAAIDVEIEVTKDDSGLRTVRSTKMKSGVDGAKWNFRLKVVPLMHETDSCVIEYTSEQAKPRAKDLGAQQKLMLEALRELGPMGQRVEIAEVINLAWHRGGVDSEVTPDARPPKKVRANMVRALKSIPESYNVVIDGKFASIGTVKIGTEEDWK